MPGTWRSEPLRPSSPQNERPSVQAELSSPAATSSPTAIGRSRPAPPFRTPEGEVDGETSERPRQPAREDGGTDPVPRLVHRGIGETHDGESGRPLETCTSTETALPTAPVSVAEAMTACCTAVNGRIDRIPMPDMFQAWDGDAISRRQ